MDTYIIVEPHMERFREFSFNPDAFKGPQIVEQVYYYDHVLDVFSRSTNNEDFADILNVEAKTYLHDKGTTGYTITEAFLKNLSSYAFVNKDRILMASLAKAKDSTCKDCIHHSRCKAVYEQIDSRDCSEDPVKDCDFFIHNDLI